MRHELYAEEHQIFRDTFKKFVAREITPNAKKWDEERAVPREVWLKMGEQGFLCPWLPEEYGGMGVDFGYSAIINEELIRGDGFGVGVPLHSDCATPYIYSYASEEVKQRCLQGCTTGERISAIALTEPNAGSDLAAIRTTARKDGESYVLNGQKTFITNGYVADQVVVAAKTDTSKGSRGISLFYVEDGTPGFVKARKLEKMGWHAQDTAELFFEDCRIPASYLIGKEGEGFKYMMEKLQQERLEVSIKCQANAEEAFKEALKYSKEREAFDRPIGHFQNTAFKLAEMATDIQLGRTFLDNLILKHINGENIVQEISMAKYWLGEMVNRVAYQAVQIHGGYGYMEEYRICRIYKDVRSLSIFAGTSEIMKLIISRNLGLRD